MTEPRGQSRSRTAGAGRAPWWSTRATQRRLLLLSALLLEILPVEGVLVIATGYGGHTITLTPAPFWFLLGTILLAAGIGRYLSGISPARLAVVSLPPLILCALLLIRISPAMYGLSGNGFLDWSWVFAIAGDVINHTPAGNALFPLLVLLGYIWWRGLKLGIDPPDFPTILRRFKFGMIAMVVIAIAAIVLPPVVAPATVGVLGLLLLAEVFSGLMAAALGRMERNQAEHARDPYLLTNDRQWLGIAMVLALVTVGFALLINLIINYQSVGALLTLLGPVGPVVSRLATLLTDGLAQLLHFLFGWLFGWLKPFNSQPSKIHTGPLVPTTEKNTHTKATIPSIWLQIARIVLELGSVAMVILMFLWVVRKLVTRRLPREAILDEERESLDASSIFRNQMRAFLAELRPARAAAAVDPLTPGSVRYLYRGVLEAASRRGLARGPSETPDEYSARLSTEEPLEQRAAGGQTPLEEFSETYDSTRYAERPPSEEEMPPIRRQVQGILKWLQR